MIASVILFLLSLYVYYFLDRRMLAMGVKAFGIYAVALFFAAGLLWGVWRLGAWWADVLWVFVANGVSSVIILSRIGHADIRRVLLLGLSLFTSTMFVGGMMVIGKPWVHGFLPIAAILMSLSAASVSKGLHAYWCSKRATRSHQEYLLGNGASSFESLLPSLRRGFRASLAVWLRQWSLVSVVTLPLVFAAMLFGGMLPEQAMLSTLSLTMGSFAAAVGTMILALLLFERADTVK